MTRGNLIMAQKEDASLARCFASALAPEMVRNKEVSYFVDNDVLMRRWKSRLDFENEWSYVVQVAVPTSCRQSVSSLAHDHL